MLNFNQPCIIYIRAGSQWVRRAGFDDDMVRAHTLIYPSFREAWAEVHECARLESRRIWRVIALSDGTTVHFWGATWIKVGRARRV